MSKRNYMLAICGVLVFGVVATQAATGKKHRHATIQVYAATPVTTAPGQIGSGIAFCPAGSAATGGGENYVTGLATVDMGFEGNAYYVLVDNFDSTTTSQMEVQVACTAGTTRAKARPVSRAQVRSNVDAMVAEREAAHSAEEYRLETKNGRPRPTGAAGEGGWDEGSPEHRGAEEYAFFEARCPTS